MVRSGWAYASHYQLMPCDSAAIGLLARFCWGDLDPSKEWGCFVSLSQGPSHFPPPDGFLAYYGDLHVQFLFRPHPLLLPAPTTSAGDFGDVLCGAGKRGCS